MRGIVVIMSIFFFTIFDANAQKDIEIQIASEKVTCKNQSEKMCFQAKKTTDPYWTFQIEELQNLNYEPGFEYTLKVIVVSNDGQIAYKVIDVLAKEEKESIIQE